MESGSLDLRSLVDGLGADELTELRDAVASRLCREKYGADTIDGLLAKWGRTPSCPECGDAGAWLDGSTPNGRARYRCPSCSARSGALSGTIFAAAKLPLHKIMRIVEVMRHIASLRLIELTCEVSHNTAFLWRHKVFSTVSGWQDRVVLSGRVWIDETCFEDTRVEREPGAPRRRGLSRDKVCVVVAIDSWGQALAVVSENGKPSTKRINRALGGAHQEGVDHRPRLREGPQRPGPRARVSRREVQGRRHGPHVPRADGAREPPVLVGPQVRRAVRVHEIRESPGVFGLVRVPAQST